MKKNAKAETKALIDEWETKLTNFTKETFEPKRKVPETKKKGRGGRGGRGKEAGGDMEEEVNETEEENSNNRVLRKLKEPAPSQPTEKRVTRGKRNVTQVKDDVRIFYNEK